MAVILEFPADASEQAGRGPVEGVDGGAEILLFTGVQYSRTEDFSAEDFVAEFGDKPCDTLRAELEDDTKSVC